jgi:hypothetical protein
VKRNCLDLTCSCAHKLSLFCFVREYKTKSRCGSFLCMTFWHRLCCREEYTFHVPNVVNLPDNQFLYVIGEFNYSLWNIAMNEPAFGTTRRWAVRNMSSNEPQFLSAVSETSAAFLVCFIYFHFNAITSKNIIHQSVTSRR